MNQLSKLDRFYSNIKENRWHWYFSIFCRIVLALGFIPSGLTKIMGERFASGLSVNHPMGQYLEALYHTGYYYNFIGIVQVIAAVLLLIPRTVTLGALLYFPIIVNISILSFALRFDGSIFSAPLMVLANLYILVWNYDKLKYILPFKKPDINSTFVKKKIINNKFPFKFFLAVIVTSISIVFITLNMYEVMPRNRLSDCKKQFENTVNESAGFDFCECIHSYGNTLNECLKEYENSKE